MCNVYQINAGYAAVKKCKTYSMQQKRVGQRLLMHPKRQFFTQFPQPAAHVSHILEQLQVLKWVKWRQTVLANEDRPFNKPFSFIEGPMSQTRHKFTSKRSINKSCGNLINIFTRKTSVRSSKQFVISVSMGNRWFWMIW